MTSTVHTNNASKFATQAGDRLDLERRAGITSVLNQIERGRPGRAFYELVRSVERQAAIAGIRNVVIQPKCPCGGRCDHGRPLS